MSLSSHVERETTSAKRFLSPFLSIVPSECRFPADARDISVNGSPRRSCSLLPTGPH